MKNRIEWNANGYGNITGYAETKSGLKAFINKVQRTTGIKPLYSIWIEGDKKNTATRATIETINKILEER